MSKSDPWGRQCLNAMKCGASWDWMKTNVVASWILRNPSLLEPEKTLPLCQFTCVWDSCTAMCQNIMECPVTSRGKLRWRHDTHTTSYLQKVYWKICPKYPKRPLKHSKGPPKWTKNRIFRCPGRPLDPARQGRLENDSKMMPRGAPKRPIWGQKSALENKKDIPNEDKYQLCEEIGKSNEKV